MSNLCRHTQLFLQRFSSIRRTATTVVANNTGTQVKTTGGTSNLSQALRSNNAGNQAVRDALKRSKPADPIRPRAAGEPPLIPLVGTALNIWGQIAYGVVAAISVYFIYINYITNPEFYKSLKISREASKRDVPTQPANREGTIGQKFGDAAVPKGALNKHI